MYKVWTEKSLTWPQNRISSSEYRVQILTVITVLKTTRQKKIAANTLHRFPSDLPQKSRCCSSCTLPQSISVLMSGSESDSDSTPNSLRHLMHLTSMMKALSAVLNARRNRFRHASDCFYTEHVISNTVFALLSFFMKSSTVEWRISVLSQCVNLW